MELEAVLAKVSVLGISLEHRRHRRSESASGNRDGNTARAKARDRSGSGEEVYVLRGLKEDVLSVTELLNRAVHEILFEDLQDKKEAMLALTVQWSIQDVDGAWQELSLHDNYVLEDAHVNKKLSVDVMAPDRMMTEVNLRVNEAKNWQTGIIYKVKRSETETTFRLPTQWEPMQEEVFKKVELQPNSHEYQVVAQDFHKTARYNIQKIERVQNLYLWHAYAVCRQRILVKNSAAELGERSLYHGTSAESCSCIERDRFDRSFAGTHVHRVILAASSDYFRGMFTSGMRESHQTYVALPFLLASELEALIGCSYSGTLSLSWDCVFEITCTALQLQFQPALSLCLNFMRQEIEASSCLDIASFAEAYGMLDLLEEANDFVLRNFWEVSSTAKFQDLQAEKLLDLLRSDGLCVPSELAVFRAVISWIEADPEERLGQASLLMTGVRFPLMTFREFREVRAINLRMECFGNKEVELYGSALKEFGFSVPKTQDLCRVRRPKDALVLVGGDQLYPDVGQFPSRELWFANSLRSGTGLVKEIEWRRLGEMPDKPKFRHGVTAMEGKLYVFGGCYFYAKDNIMKSAYSYDPVQDSWKRLADMQEFRSNFSVVAHEERLYAIGGDKEINTNVDSVEMYNPDTDSWSFVKPLDQALSGYAVTVVDGGIFVSGGFNCKYVCLVSMFLYHPERGTTYLADMAQDRALHCMEALRGHLYVSGGVSNLRKFYNDQQACEVYDPGNDSWTAFASLPVPHVSAASAILEEKIYILGGYCQDDYSETGLVHRFDPSTQRWENIGKLPGAVTDIRACLLQLPQHFRQ
ncbi:kelch-like protein 33 isoform X2 [Xiphias gladius]|uniref:kelch-like protein 33 isoform X2 n=1 Tax=Xiphias gladius TaxID=8245 RepID=UPI001A9833F2|nr:kelch-like protein 33 isoform X2 [Xiphias gladius]